MFLGKVVLKICTKFTGEHSCRSVISIKLLCSFIEIKLQHGCTPVNLLRILKQFYWNHTPAWVLLHIFRTIFLKNTSGRLLLVFLLSEVSQYIFCWHKPIAFSQCHIILKLCQSLLLKGSYDIFSELCDHNVKTFPQYGASLKSISYKPYCSNVLTITFAETKLSCFIKVTWFYLDNVMKWVITIW